MERPFLTREELDASLAAIEASDAVWRPEEAGEDAPGAPGRAGDTDGPAPLRPDPLQAAERRRRQLARLRHAPQAALGVPAFSHTCAGVGCAVCRWVDAHTTVW